MYGDFQSHLQQQLASIREAGLEKVERVITTPQDAHVGVSSGREVLNLCANNYLGLAEHPRVREAAKAAIDKYGYGMAIGTLLFAVMLVFTLAAMRLLRSRTS